MCKKLLLFVSLLGLFLGNFNYLSAEILTPLKKPKLSEDEISIRISKNILKPVKKPKKNNIKITTSETVKLNNIKILSLNIPKKKPTITGSYTASKVKISKYYSKKDFAIAKKAIFEMQKSRWISSLKIATGTSPKLEFDSSKPSMIPYRTMNGSKMTNCNCFLAS